MGWIRRLFSTVRSNRVDREIDDELRHHLEMRIEEYVRAGMTSAQARRKARLRFGNPLALRERTRRADIFQWLESVARDVGYGLRVMRRSPLVTFAAVVSLALGIGANTALFSVMDSLLWKKLPVKDPGELHILQSQTKKDLGGVAYWGSVTDGPGGSHVFWSFSYPFFTALRDRHPDVAAVFAVSRATFSLRGQAAAAEGRLVSGNYFSMLGVVPQAGRLLYENDDRRDSPPVVVVSHPFWKRMFGGDPEIIGRTVQINGSALTVVGITPRHFFGLMPGVCPDFFAPLSAQPGIFPDLDRRSPFQNNAYWWLNLIARGRSGSSAAAMRSRFDPVYRGILPPEAAVKGVEPPELAVSEGSRGFDFIREEASRPLWLLTSLAGLVLLIACVNVANLLLARAGARGREAMIRAALGAGRLRLIRQHLTESLFLSLSGGALALLVADRAGHGLVAMAATSSDALSVDLALNWRVLAFASAVSLLTGLLFGLLPAVRTSKLVMGSRWRSSPDSAPSSATRRFGPGRLLVTAQVAVSLVLVIVAGLFFRSLDNLYSVPLGFDPEHILLFDLDPARTGYGTEAKQALFERIARDLRSIPGVEAATWSRFPLVGRSSWSSHVRIPGAPASDHPVCQYLPVGTDFRKTMRLEMLLGRPLDERDNAAAPATAVVNESFVRRFPPDESPIGRQFVIQGENETLVEIVGVARNVRFTDLRREVIPMAYLPDAQHANPYSRAVFEVRARGNPNDVVPDVRRTVGRIDPQLPVLNIRTQNEQIDDYLNTERILSDLSLVFAAAALLLAAIGLYGVVAYSMSRRTTEIGVRMALGARVTDIQRMAMLDSAGMVLPGAAAGVLAAIAAARVLESSLYGLEASDPLTIAGSTALLTAVSFFAAWIPARRAARVDPIRSLRCE